MDRVEAAGGRIVQRNDIAAQDTGQRVVAGAQCRRIGRIVDLEDAPGQAGGERRRADGTDRAGCRCGSELVVASAGAGERQAAYRDGLGRAGMDRVVAAGGRVVEHDHVAAQRARQIVVAGDQRRGDCRVVDFRHRAGEADRQGRRRDRANSARTGRRSELVVAGAGAGERKAAHGHRLARADIDGVVGTCRGPVEGHDVAAQDAGQRVVAGGKRRCAAGVIDLGDAAGEAGRERRRRDRADGAGRHGRAEPVVAGTGAGQRETGDGHGLARADVGRVVSTRRRIAERDHVAAQDAGQRVVAGGEGRHGVGVVDLRHRARKARGESR